MNDTIDKVQGTFVPLANPVMNNTRLYIISGFRPHGSNKGESKHLRESNSTLLRLYAINVAEALDRKFTILWTHDVRLKGTIPYIHTRGTYCHSLSVSNTHSADNEEGFTHQTSPYDNLLEPPPPGVVTMVDDRILGAVSIQSDFGGNISFNLSVQDLGSTYSVISTGYTNYLVNSFSWSNSDRAKLWGTSSSLKRATGPLQSASGKEFWVCVSPPGEDVSVIEALESLAGPPVNSSQLSLSTKLTTPVTLLQQQRSTADTAGERVQEPLLVFGTAAAMTGRGGRESENQPQLVGVEGQTLKWSVPLPHSQPAQGQISSLSLSSGTLLFLTTPLGVYAYKLE